LMQALPAITENDCAKFGNAITRIQNIVGDYFAEAQGGRYTSPLLKPILDTMVKDGATGVGQSSWGPTGFAIFPDETLAFQAMKNRRKEWQAESKLSFMMSKACNNSATVSINNTKSDQHNKSLKANNL
jgi:beta-ribofuranosylaminobenzene 5'-phosphate synthase